MLKNALEVLRKKFGRHPADEEISHYLGISLKNYYKLLDEARGVCILSNDDLPPSYCEKYGRHDILEKIDQNNPFFLLADMELKNILKNAIDSLPEKEKLVLSLYYYEELTLKEIGLTLKLTESRVCQIHSLAILRLKGGLKKFRHDIT
jgi:RNA polymerase sigma factor for flagellar operon FliA